MTLARRLREARKARGLNLTQAAQELGVARTAYRLWEKGAAIPAPEFWKSIALRLEIPLATLMRDVGLLSVEEERALLRLAAREAGKSARR